MSTKGVLYAVKIVDNLRIDEINILQATMEAMKGALETRLSLHKPDDVKKERIFAYVDGNR